MWLLEVFESIVAIEDIRVQVLCMVAWLHSVRDVHTAYDDELEDMHTDWAIDVFECSDLLLFDLSKDFHDGLKAWKKKHESN